MSRPKPSARSAAVGTVRVAELLVRAAVRADPKQAMVVFATALISGLTPVLLAWGTQRLVEAALGRSGAVPLGLGAIGLAVLVIFVSEWVEAVARTQLEERTDHRLENDLMVMLGAAPGLQLAESPTVQDHLYTFLTRPKHLVGSISTVVAAGSLTVRILGAAVYLASGSLWLGVIPLLILFPVVSEVYVQREVSAMLGRVSPLMRPSRLLFETATSVDAGREIRIFGQSTILQARHLALLRAADQDQVRSRIRTVAYTAVGWSGFCAGLIAVIVLADANGGTISASIVVTLAVLSMQLIGQAEAAATVVSMLGRQTGFFERYLWLRRHLRLAAEAGRLPGSADEHQPPARLTEGIVLDNVDFRHQGADVDVLRGVNLTLPAGATVAIVGHNGAGKTTLAKLLLGLYQPTGGAIWADRRRLADLDRAAWAGSTSAAFQDFVRFQFPLATSVGLGDLSGPDDDKRIVVALAMAGAERLAESFPDGLRTPLGDTLPGGLRPSEGQWQKIAVARSAVRPRTLIRVLDEPTASLDAESEAELYRHFVRLARADENPEGRITVLISHRFNTVRHADLIVVVGAGRIEATGTHDELLQKSDWYRSIVDLQSEGYR